MAAIGLLIQAQGKLTGLSKLIQARASTPTLVPPQHLEYFTFGYNNLLADILWLRSIQDFEYCGDHLQHKEFRQQFGREINMCSKGWIYSMLDAVTRIEPKYQIAYTRGAISLSVLVNDVEGAAEILDRGTKAYPEDWYVWYCAAYHSQIEENNPAKAAAQLAEGSKHGGPPWLAISAARLYSQAGKAEFGLQAIKGFYKDLPFEEWPAKAKERFKALETELAKAGTDETEKSTN
jgi:hypothetical protein